MLRCTLPLMELDDPYLPGPANDWALIGSDQVRAWGMMLQHQPETEPIGALALTMLSIAEAQARVIGDLAARIDKLEGKEPQLLPREG